jgi:hypothetical protein
VRAELDGKDAGIACVEHQGGGAGSHFAEHSTSFLRYFDTTVTGKQLKLFVHKTSLVDGWYAGERHASFALS